MKVAIMVSGLPRFTENFDILLENLQHYNQIDWFFYLWKSNHQYDPRISPNWCNNRSDLYRRLVSYMPSNNFVASVQLADMPVFDESKKYNTMEVANPLRVWTMYCGIKSVNRIREQHEISHGKYDLVIRTRVDGMIDRPIYLDRAKEWLMRQPFETLIIPANGRLGFVPFGQTLNPVNDNFAIGESCTMSTYSRVLDYIDQYTEEGIPMTAESMLGYHLLKNNIQTPESSFEYHIGIGNFGRWL